MPKLSQPQLGISTQICLPLKLARFQLPVEKLLYNLETNSSWRKQLGVSALLKMAEQMGIIV